MLVSLIAWIYISFICLVWGHIFLLAVLKRSGMTVLSFNTSLVCLAGLSVIGTLSFCLSLFMPLDWKAHLILLIPVLIYCGSSAGRQAIRMQWSNTFTGLSRTGYYLLTICILMVLTISVHTIAHPDTLNYHAKSILLFEKYGVVPGIANLKKELGFQCGWFASIALFKPGLAAFRHVIFLNGTILCWYFLFVVQKIFSADKEKDRWIWLLLLFYTFFSWTQIRLTAASASPDFIVSLYCWAAFYAFLQKENNLFYLSLVVLYCCAAILTKLSAIVIVLLAVMTIAGSFRLRTARLLILYSCVAMTILFIRNRIASGYLLYPFPRPDIFNPPWKMELSTIVDVQHYIAGYARDPATRDWRGAMQAPFSEWLPKWWSGIYFPDRLLVLGILAGVLLHLGLALSRLAKGKGTPGPFVAVKKYFFAFPVALAGSLIWFLGAPSPRFGTGYLIPLIFLLYRALPFSGLTAYLTSFVKKPLSAKYSALLLVTGCLTIAIAAYTTYRCSYFLEPSELIMPSGIVNSAYAPIGCENVRVDLEKDSITTGQKTGPLYCIEPIGGFSPIGTTISDGFKPAVLPLK